ncbi:unnamed protein product, partial [Allacma fusca]
MQDVHTHPTPGFSRSHINAAQCPPPSSAQEWEDTPAENTATSVTSLVPFYGSSSDDDDEESFDMVSIGVQVNFSDFIQCSESEVQNADTEVQVVLPTSSGSVHQVPGLAA